MLGAWRGYLDGESFVLVGLGVCGGTRKRWGCARRAGGPKVGKEGREKTEKRGLKCNEPKTSILTYLPQVLFPRGVDGVFSVYLVYHSVDMYVCISVPCVLSFTLGVLYSLCVCIYTVPEFPT